MTLAALVGRGSAFDPVALAGVCAVLALAGLLACLLPALRAARVAPMRALRGE
jgi:putative ABC transport system permease protein